MKKAVLFVLAMFCLAATPVSVDLLMVQSGTSFSVDGEHLTLHGVTDTLYFSERPERKAGVMKNQKYASLWGEDVKKHGYPNAVLSILGDTPVNVVLELVSTPQVQGDIVQYKVKVLNGELPNKGGACSLFIDAMPTLVNGQITD